MSRCHACVLTCMDYRIQYPVSRWLENKGLKENYDYIALPGASRNFLSEGKVAMIETSIRLHQIKEVYLIHHEDCGAYGLGNLPVEEQLKRQEEDMRQAAQVIKARYPHLVIHLVFVHLDGSILEV
ncbi:hypothetical protein SAMN00808754_3248 [Thermanaeromonas toyohensis ToBE]|uniref:Carbonic anhydrase n=1 Tax=Thermanaeromonas toyohensis ToBE TaxID=698762 RepID=A0A1W1W355_9FIRM|nr:carbonic anhydrase [Thermanaeromonas toyohensis]SMC00059.1 hypothetical protein SAMN00808754_3248 [Thermanaeromonas toyohensis ToBE]